MGMTRKQKLGLAAFVVGVAFIVLAGDLLMPSVADEAEAWLKAGMEAQP